MKIEVTDGILALANEARSLRDFINDKLPKLKARYRDEKDHLDKHRDGFEMGDATRSFNSLEKAKQYASNLHRERLKKALGI